MSRKTRCGMPGIEPSTASTPATTASERGDEKTCLVI